MYSVTLTLHDIDAETPAEAVSQFMQDVANSGTVWAYGVTDEQTERRYIVDPLATQQTQEVVD